MQLQSIKQLLWLVIACFFVSCEEGRFITSWVKASDTMYPYRKILVIAIVNDSLHPVRMQLEDRLTDGLNSYGYQAVSALRRYGPRGLSKMGEANMFLHLNDEEIDAVLAVVLVNNGRDSVLNAKRTKDFSSVYFYDRLWQYKDIAGAFSANEPASASFMWEVLFFELPTLEPRCNLRTNSFGPKALFSITEGIPENIIKHLANEKIIKHI